jgi:hypothetical protein
MFVMSGMLITFFILHFLPNEMTFNALHIAGANDKMNIVNFSIDPEEKYTIGAGYGRFLSGTRLFRDGPVTSGSLSVRQIGS